MKKGQIYFNDSTHTSIEILESGENYVKCVVNGFNPILNERLKDVEHLEAYIQKPFYLTHEVLFNEYELLKGAQVNDDIKDVSMFDYKAKNGDILISKLNMAVFKILGFNKDKSAAEVKYLDVSKGNGELELDTIKRHCKLIHRT